MQLSGRTATSVLLTVACAAMAYAVTTGGRLGLFVLVGLVGMAVGAYVGLRHPLWLYWCLAGVMGFLPFGALPGVGLPMYLLFAAAVVLAALVHPNHRRTLHPLEKLLLLLVLASAVSVCFTAVSLADYISYVKWAIVTLVVVALLRLSPPDLRRFGQVFVVAAAANAIFAVAIIAAGSTQIIRILSPFGYGGADIATRFVYNAEGQSQSIRLGGTWVDPNAAGIGLVVAFCIGLIVFEGWRRTSAVALFGITVVMTLSRSAIFSIVVGVVLVLVFHKMRPRVRAWFTGGIAVVLLVAISTPAIRNRILSSFGGDDVGSTARGDALRNFPGQMSDHWIFGLGWARPEFSNGSFAFTLNFVANAPLLTIYRGGIIVGILFVAVLLAGWAIGWRAITSDSLARAIFGGVFIGFTIVALQLDHPVVAVLPITTTFSLFLTMLVKIDLDRRREERLGSSSSTERPPITGPGTTTAIPLEESTRAGRIAGSV